MNTIQETEPNETSCGRRISSVDRQAREFHAFLTENPVRPIYLLSLLAPEAAHSGDVHFFRLATEEQASRYPAPSIIKNEKRWMVNTFGHYFGIDALQLGLDFSLEIENDDLSIVPYIHFVGSRNIQW